MCLYPTLAPNKKYTPNKKNGWQVPPIHDNRALLVAIGCGNCIECRTQKAREWQVRLQEDIKTNKNGKFVALTFSNESIKHIVENFHIEKKINVKNDKQGFYYDGQRYEATICTPIKNLHGYTKDNAIATKAVHLFRERWRKEHGHSPRHWLVTELGHKGTENIHLHGIIWTDLNIIEELEKHWQYGFTWKGYYRNGKLENYVNNRTINYTVKYIQKIDKDHRYYKSTILASPGIGGNYKNTANALYNKFKGELTDETYRTETGHKIAMPTYWRNQIYTDKEREQLWLQRLNKMERWVCGEKADISQDQNSYINLLNHHRKRNKEFGYGNNEKSWKQEYYENQRREIIIETRIQKAKDNNNKKNTTPSAGSNQKG